MKKSEQLDQLLRSAGPLAAPEDFTESIMAHLEMETVADPVEGFLRERGVALQREPGMAFASEVMERLDGPATEMPPLLSTTVKILLVATMMGLVLMAALGGATPASEPPLSIVLFGMLEALQEHWLLLLLSIMVGGGLLFGDYCLRSFGTMQGRKGPS